MVFPGGPSKVGSGKYCFEKYRTLSVVDWLREMRQTLALCYCMI